MAAGVRVVVGGGAACVGVLRARGKVKPFLAFTSIACTLIRYRGLPK